MRYLYDAQQTVDQAENNAQLNSQLANLTYAAALRHSFQREVEACVGFNLAAETITDQAASFCSVTPILQAFIDTSQTACINVENMAGSPLLADPNASIDGTIIDVKAMMEEVYNTMSSNGTLQSLVDTCE